MANTPAIKANAAFVDEDYDLALALYKQVVCIPLCRGGHGLMIPRQQLLS